MQCVLDLSTEYLQGEIEMDLHGYAYFVERPRRLEDLQRPHLIERERPYSIVTAVQLPQIDYENFVTDCWQTGNS